MNKEKKKVIIIGGGFAGLNAAKSLKSANIDLLLIDRTNHHLFQPLLYQVASAALSPGDIAIPIRMILRNQKNATVLMANIISIDKEKKEIKDSSGEIYPYDYLVIAIGMRHSYFGHGGWERFAPGLKTISDALNIREMMLLAFEEAERSSDRNAVKKLMRFVVIGGGPTGVEMAGAISEIARQTMVKNFRRIRPELSEVYLIEALDRILPTYPPNLSEKARHYLEKMGVRVLLNTKVIEVKEHTVELDDHTIVSSNIIWAAGNEGAQVLKTINTPLDRAGRVIVEKDLSIPGHQEVFVIGDCSLVLDAKGAPLPGIAPVAIQEGKYVAKVIKKELPSSKREPFSYFDKGSMATIGRAKAVAVIGKLTFSGYFAWLMWSLIHIAYLISFRNRVLVMIQWIFWYFTGARNVRLIRHPIDELEKNDSE